MIPGDLLSACPNRQFHTLPSRAALSNSYPNALRAMQGGKLYHFYDGLWYDPAGTRTTNGDNAVHKQSHPTKIIDENKVRYASKIFKFLIRSEFTCISWEDFQSNGTEQI